MPGSTPRRSRSTNDRAEGGRSSSRNTSNSNNRSRSAGRSRSVASADSASSGGSRPLMIKPLSSVGDAGAPSNSIARDAQRVINFMLDERHLVAYHLYLSVQNRLEEMEETRREYMVKHNGAIPTTARQSNNKRSMFKLPRPAAAKGETFNEEEYQKVKAVLKKHKEKLDFLEKSAPLFMEARDNMDDGEEGWELAQTLFGVTTYYRRETDGSLSIKLEGELKGIPLFEQVAVLREVDLHSYWAPFVTSSLTLAHLDKLDTVGWMMVGLPNFGLARDGCFRAIGCDCVAEDGSFYLVGRGVEDRKPGVLPDEETKFLSDDPILKTLDIPPLPTRMGSGRLTIKTFEAKIHVMAPDHCHTYILANVDPNLAFIPQALIEFIMKKMCGLLLNKMQTAAKKIIKNPVRNVHAQRMRDESAFYQQWLLPKFRAICADKGWVLPNIAAFDLTEAQQVEAQRMKHRKIQQAHSFSYFEGDRAVSDGSVSTRSEPAYRNRLDSDENSEISSLSGTSQSIWKNNPIAIYLRDIESKTQERKSKEADEARQKAAARLKPRPLPMEKRDRLKELKMHKERRRPRTLSSDGGSTASFGNTTSGGLHTVDEDDVNTIMTDHYSPITAVIKRRRWSRLLSASFLVVLLSILLHADRFLPTFDYDNLGRLAPVLRDAVALLYIIICGVIHCALLDVELIFAFEAIEMASKSGDGVKSFYRGKTRLGVAWASGCMVFVSVFKALARASFKASIIASTSIYKLLVSKYFLWVAGTEEDVAGASVSTTENEIANATSVVAGTSFYKSLVSRVFLGAAGTEGGVEVAAADAMANATANATVLQNLEQKLGVPIEEHLSSLYAASLSVYAACLNMYGVFMNFMQKIFDLQMEVFVHSNRLGRTVEGLVTTVYKLYIGILTGFINAMSSILSWLLSFNDSAQHDFSWRQDAFDTLRPLLLYSSVLILVVLIFVTYWMGTYRHGPSPPSGSSGRVASRAATSTHSEDKSEPMLADVSSGGTMPIPKPRRMVSPTRSSDSATRRRLKFRRKRKEAVIEDDNSE